MSVTLTADMRAVIQAAHLCFAATVSPDGKPNVSPKGTIPVQAVVLLALERAAALVSPGYWRVPDERAMRTLWRERRAALDPKFEAYLAQVEPFRVSR
jgi:Pyridoxamine 5'-phosphate oxidase